MKRNIIAILKSFFIALFISTVVVLPDGIIEWKDTKKLFLQFTIKSSVKSHVQIFYDIGNHFNEKDSVLLELTEINRYQKLKFTLPNSKVKYIRLDPLSTSGKINIKKIQLIDNSNRLVQDYKLNTVRAINQIKDINIESNILKISTDLDAVDPILFLDIDYPLDSRKDASVIDTFRRIQRKVFLVFFLLWISLLLAFFEIDDTKNCIQTNWGIYRWFLKALKKKFKMIRSLFSFLRLIIKQKHLILIMARREVATQYTGSLLGFIWTFIHPIVLILVFWVVFSIGFKVKPLNNVPFVVWLTAGMASWFVFADILIGATGVIISNPHLVKKTLFHTQILPVIKIVASLIMHSIFLLVLLGLIIFQKMPFSFYYFQFLYYLFCMMVLSLGLGWAFSALNVFIRDIGQIVSIVLQIGFWATPIFWDIAMMPDNIQMILKLNPMYYIIQGYRDSFIYFCPFWQHPLQTAYFWIITSLIFVIGALIFKKLKPQFADVL